MWPICMEYLRKLTNTGETRKNTPTESSDYRQRERLSLGSPEGQTYQ